MDNTTKHISIEPYNEHYILVTYPDSNEFPNLESQINLFGGEKLPMPNADGKESLKHWLVDKTKKQEMVDLKNSLEHEKLFTGAFSSFTNQKEQTKYRRAMSDDEYSSDEDLPDLTVKNLKNMHKSPKRDKKDTPKLLITQDDLYSSESSASEHEDSDDSDFPEAKSPKNHERKYRKILKRFRSSPKNKK